MDSCFFFFFFLNKKSSFHQLPQFWVKGFSILFIGYSEDNDDIYLLYTGLSQKIAYVKGYVNKAKGYLVQSMQRN